MSITFRPGTMEDSQSVFHVFIRSIMDYGERMNVMAITGGNDPAVLEALWQRRKSMFEFLAEDASQFWVAEKDGELIAYARAIEHAEVQELTEFFVLPGQQSAGVGRELLARAFPQATARYRTIIATLDERALARYLRAGVYGRFPIKYFYRKAQKVEVETDLAIEPLHLDLHLADLKRIDQKILLHARSAIHKWVASTRTGFVYRRSGEVVGYGYVGSSTGPFALLEEDDFPAVLAHAESLRAEVDGEFGVEVPLINQKAIQHLLERKYQIDGFTALFMSNEPFGRFENYLCFSPIFFM